MQKDLKKIKDTLPDLHNAYLANAEGTTLGFFPPINAKGETTIGLNFSDRPYYQVLTNTLKPFTSDIFMGRGGIDQPIFVITIPILEKNTFKGYCLGAVNLTQIKSLIKSHIGKYKTYTTILDRKDQIVVSTNPNYKVLDVYHIPQGTVQKFANNISLHIPEIQKNKIIPQIWEESYYSSMHPLDIEGWKVLIEMPYAPFKIWLQEIATRTLFVSLLLFLLALAVSKWLGQIFARVPDRLGMLSSRLAEKIETEDKIEWPHSNIVEIAKLIENFKELESSLRMYFSYLIESNVDLERKVEERSKALKEEGYKNEIYLRNSSDGIHILDTEGNVVNCSDSFCNMLGYKREEMIGMNVSNWEAQLNLFELKVIINKQINNTNISMFETYHRCKDGRLIAVEITGYPILLDGKTRLFNSARDITERKRIQNSLIESEFRFRNFFEKNSSVMLLIDPEKNQIVSANQAAANFYGYSIKELEGLSFSNVSILSMDNLNYRHKLASGELRDVEVYTSPIELADKKIIYSIVHDITERKQMDQKLSSALFAAEAANIAKGQFLAMMSHEIRTPLNGVVGMIQLLAATPLTIVQREYVDTIFSSSESLINIVNDILDYSKIEAGKLDLNHMHFDLNEVMKKLHTAFKSQIDSKGLKLFTNIHSNVPTNLMGDPIRIGQILNNLVGNAIKFTQSGSVAVDVRLLEQTSKDISLGFSVKDTGIGIPNEHFGLLFQKFSQVDTSASRKFSGTGLGLAICKQLVELMKGEINVRSQINMGSEFYFNIRLNTIDTFVLDEKVLEKNIILDTSSKLLLVEDNETNQKVALALLNFLGLRTDIANDGQEAIRAIQEKDYDLIFMDIQMPGMDGYEVTKRIRKMQLNIPIIAMTANAMPSDQKACFEAGMDDFLSKPVDMESLKKALYKWLKVKARI